MYDIDDDINKIQKMIIADKEILTLLDLIDKPRAEIGSRIIKKSKWDDLVDAQKRLCIFFLPSRSTNNSILFNEIVEIDCHVPAIEDYKARKVIGRVMKILNNRTVNGRYLNIKGHLGELRTAQGFYCHGCRFGYYNPY